MTQPQRDPLAAAQQREDDLAALEDDARDAATGDLRVAVSALIVDASKAWIAAAGSLTVVPKAIILAAIIARLRKRVRKLPLPTARAVESYLDEAWDLGVEHAITVTGTVDVDRPKFDLDDLIEQARGQRADAVKAFGRVKSWDGMLTAFAATGRVANDLDAGVAARVNETANGAARAVADAAEVGYVWVAERDTHVCLTCLAYSGHTVKAGGSFPAGLTFGKKSTVKARLKTPPAHPACRCQLWPWSEDWPQSSSVGFPDALRREAERSVLRGESGESEPARLRAADRLLKRGTDLPKTVKARARRAVKVGRFPTRAGGG